MIARHEFNNAEIARILHSPTGPVARDLLKRGAKVQAAAKRLCPVDHGRLRSSIAVTMTAAGLGRILIVEVGTDVKYARWVHDGTGLHGPRGALIYPRTASVMVFTPRTQGSGSGRKLIPRKNRTVVFARWTRGMKGTPFLRDALPAAHRG